MHYIAFFKLMFGGTDNHMVLVDVFGSKGVTGKEAEEALDKIGITLSADSRTGHGTKVEIAFPLENDFDHIRK